MYGTLHVPQLQYRVRLSKPLSTALSRTTKLSLSRTVVVVRKTALSRTTTLSLYAININGAGQYIIPKYDTCKVHIFTDINSVRELQSTV